jgi:hypothetical protein
MTTPIEPTTPVGVVTIRLAPDPRLQRQSIANDVGDDGCDRPAGDRIVPHQVAGTRTKVGQIADDVGIRRRLLRTPASCRTPVTAATVVAAGQREKRARAPAMRAGDGIDPCHHAVGERRLHRRDALGHYSTA